MPNKILITGGAGFIGSNLAKYLVKSNHELFIVDDFSSGEEEIKSDNIKYIKEDISKVDLLKFDQKFDIIYHLAAISRINVSFEDIKRTYEVNLMGTINVLEYCKTFNSNLIFAGTSCHYFDHLSNPYALSKTFGENVCESYHKYFNINVSIARFFNVYGNEEKKINKFSTLISIFAYNKKNNIPFTIYGQGNKKRDFIHVDDLIDGLDKLKNISGFNVFDFGTGKNYSVLEIANFFNPNQILFKKDRQGEAEETLAEINFTKIKLNWQPKIDLENYIRRLQSN